MGRIRSVAMVALALGLLAAPLAAEAQPARKVWRIGFLGDGPRAERASISTEPFREGLRELGYVEGQNVVIEERWSEGLPVVDVKAEDQAQCGILRFVLAQPDILLLVAEAPKANCAGLEAQSAEFFESLIVRQR